MITLVANDALAQLAWTGIPNEDIQCGLSHEGGGHKQQSIGGAV